MNIRNTFAILALGLASSMAMAAPAQPAKPAQPAMPARPAMPATPATPATRATPATPATPAKAAVHKTKSCKKGTHLHKGKCVVNKAKAKPAAVEPAKS